MNWGYYHFKALQDCLINEQHTYFVSLSFLFCLSYIKKSKKEFFFNFFFFSFFLEKVGGTSRGSRRRYAPGAALF